MNIDTGKGSKLESLVLMWHQTHREGQLILEVDAICNESLQESALASADVALYTQCQALAQGPLTALKCLVQLGQEVCDGAAILLVSNPHICLHCEP